MLKKIIVALIHHQLIIVHKIKDLKLLKEENIKIKFNSHCNNKNL